MSERGRSGALEVGPRHSGHGVESSSGQSVVCSRTLDSMSCRAISSLIGEANLEIRNQSKTGSVGAIESAIRRVINLRLKGNGVYWKEENAEGMLVLRAAALTGRWQVTMERTQAAMARDRRRDWQWEAPDIVAELNSGVPIKPPATQHGPTGLGCSSRFGPAPFPSDTRTEVTDLPMAATWPCVCSTLRELRGANPARAFPTATADRIEKHR